MNYQWCEKIEKINININWSHFHSKDAKWNYIFTETDVSWFNYYIIRVQWSENGFDPINQVCVFVTRQIFSWHPTHKVSTAHHSFPQILPPQKVIFGNVLVDEIWTVKREHKNSVDNLQEIFDVIDWLNDGRRGKRRLEAWNKQCKTILFTSPRCFESKSRKTLSTIKALRGKWDYASDFPLFYLPFISHSIEA
jgi:hypothetical protein